MTSTGTATATSQDSPTSSRSAMMMPPTIVIGAPTSMMQPMTTSIWICWMSLVFRVMSEGAPKCASSRELKLMTRRKRASRRSAPMPIAAFAPARTEPIWASTWTKLKPSIHTETDQMWAVSPLATPLSMMSALRLGRRRPARLPTSWSATTTTSVPR